MHESRPLIAVVDDEEAVCRALRRLLQSLGFDVESFPSGAEFLAWLSDRRPDCLILDLHMPGVGGFEVLEQLQNVHPPLPVVVITGRDTAETRDRVRRFNTAAYLRKPVEGDALVAAVSGSLERP